MYLARLASHEILDDDTRIFAGLAGFVDGVTRIFTSLARFACLTSEVGLASFVVPRDFFGFASLVGFVRNVDLLTSTCS